MHQHSSCCILASLSPGHASFSCRACTLLQLVRLRHCGTSRHDASMLPCCQGGAGAVTYAWYISQPLVPAIGDAVQASKLTGCDTRRPACNSLMSLGVPGPPPRMPAATSMQMPAPTCRHRLSLSAGDCYTTQNAASLMPSMPMQHVIRGTAAAPTWHHLQAVSIGTAYSGVQMGT